MTKVGGGPKPPVQVPIHEQTGKAEAQKEAVKADAKGAQVQRDGFEASRSPLANHLQALQAQRGKVKLQFSNAEMAELVKTFGAILKQNPQADRKKRAKLFAEALLKKKKKFKKFFSSAAEQDLENLFDAIAEQLESSPVFAQLVDNVSEESIKFAGG